MFEATLELKPDNIEMRKVYGNVVREKIVENTPIIALEADLMSAMAMDGVHRDHPQHVINCGIMEANVIGVAAGLSLTGRVPFVHTFTAFASRRCFDQLFMSLDYQKNNVKVIASDAGVTACHNGGAHMSFEDMGIVRGLANSIVLEVTDAVMFRERLLLGAHHPQAGDAGVQRGVCLHYR
jgi:transketolase